MGGWLRSATHSFSLVNYSKQRTHYISVMCNKLEEKECVVDDEFKYIFILCRNCYDFYRRNYTICISR